MKYRPASLLAFALLAVTWARSADPVQSTLLIYDNGGGFAYGGLKIILYPSGVYEKQVYTDALNDRQAPERGTFAKVGQAYVFSHASQRIVYHTITVGASEYLLDGHTFDEFSRTHNWKLLEAKMRRVGKPPE